MHLSVNCESTARHRTWMTAADGYWALCVPHKFFMEAVWINMHQQVGYYILIAAPRAIQQTVVDCDKGTHLLYFTTEIIIMYRMCVCLDKDDWSVFNCQCCSVSSPGQRCRLMRVTSWKHGLFRLWLYNMFVVTVFCVHRVIYLDSLPCWNSAQPSR